MEFGGEEKNKLDNLAAKLNSRNANNIIDPGRSEIKREDETLSYNRGKDRRSIREIKEEWQSRSQSNFDEMASKLSNMAGRKNNLVKKIFIFSVLFFLLAAGVTAFVFLGGTNMVSSKNVDIKVTGPLSVGSGQEVSFDINVINNNNTDLEGASLLVEYPSGTRSASDLSKEITQEKFELGTIKTGKSYSQNIKVAFFGEKDTSKEMKISLEYRVKNSSALFYKEKLVEVTISSAPVIITPVYPKEVNSNQPIELNLEIASNSQDKINDFLVNVEYPFGFVFSSASPGAAFGNNTWQFSNLNPGEKKNISIKGKIIGQDNEERVFRISAGTPSENDERKIAIPFSQLVESVTVKKAFIGIDVITGGSSGDYIGQGGAQTDVQLIVRNNLPSKIFNVQTEVSFRGGAFDPSGVNAQSGGFFQSSNSTILWDTRAVPDFSEMGPGTEKSLSFSVAPLTYSSVPKGIKPEIEMTVTTKGQRILESGSVEDVSATEVRKIILATNLRLSVKTVRSSGNIENSGPIPPQVNTPTTYSVVWTISNSVNQVSNLEVRATLPPYVKWTGQKYPSSENFSYNELTHEVVWNAGQILPGSGSGTTKKEIYFQVEFLPSTSQVGQLVSLVGEASLSGIDKVTGLKISAKGPAATTNFSGDASYHQGDERVVQ